MLIVAALAAAVAGGLAGSDKVLAQEPPVKRTVIQRNDLPGAKGKEVVMYEALIAPGAESGRHFHPGPEHFYVLEGALVLEADGHEPATLHKGQAGHNPPEHVHNVKNASASEPAKALAVLIAEKGQPLATPVK
jgi:quercetin dioxygenase-like cupin family protein